MESGRFGIDTNSNPVLFVHVKWEIYPLMRLLQVFLQWDVSELKLGTVFDCGLHKPIVVVHQSNWKGRVVNGNIWTNHGATRHESDKGVNDLN